MKRILILPLKDETRFYDVSTIELRNTTALEIVRLFSDDYKFYWRLLASRDEDIEKVELPPDFALLPTLVQDAWAEVVKNYKAQLATHKDYKVWAGLLNEAKSGNAKAAWSLIKDRSDCGIQYEKFTVENVWEPPQPKQVDPIPSVCMPPNRFKR
jgi:hypothetical protein